MSLWKKLFGGGRDSRAISHHAISDISVTPASKTDVELRIRGTSETIGCLEALELGLKLALGHLELAKEKHQTMHFEYGTIKADLTGQEIFALSLLLQIEAIPLAGEVIEGGWRGQAGRALLNRIEEGAPIMTMAEKARAGREALKDPGATTGKKHLATDGLYSKLKRVIEAARPVDDRSSAQKALDEAFLSACTEGQTDAVKELLAKGANVDARGSGGVTGLIKAIALDHLEVATALLAHGAAVDERNNNEETALLHASSRGHLAIVETLLAKGADVNAKGNIGGTPLMQAAHFGHIDIVRALLFAGAEVDAKNIDGTSALYMAARQSHVEVVRALLSHGADANTRTNDSFAVLAIAAEKGHLEIVKLLLAHGAEVDTQNNWGATALIAACVRDHVDVVQELIAHGANVLIVSKSGDSALKQARSDTVKALLASAKEGTKP
ncbi:MAG TPA: ankyrin repeat domain-containing protein [Reyranella sp.]|nr:ankyrin repeat domain-containing protein [Reyranella sp.]